MKQDHLFNEIELVKVVQTTAAWLYQCVKGEKIQHQKKCKDDCTGMSTFGSVSVQKGTFKNKC